jgi:hypothetical protein
MIRRTPGEQELLRTHRHIGTLRREAPQRGSEIISGAESINNRTLLVDGRHVQV